MKKYLLLLTVFTISHVDAQTFVCEHCGATSAVHSQDSDVSNVTLEALKKLMPHSGEINEVKAKCREVSLQKAVQVWRDYYYAKINQIRPQMKAFLQNPGEIHPELLRNLKNFFDKFIEPDLRDLSLRESQLILNCLTQLLSRKSSQVDAYKIKLDQKYAEKRKTNEAEYKKELESLEKFGYLLEDFEVESLQEDDTIMVKKWIGWRIDG